MNKQFTANDMAVAIVAGVGAGVACTALWFKHVINTSPRLSWNRNKLVDNSE